jgi:L-iditol 2-dehydrogenase
VDLAKIRVGQSVAIFGAGPVGLCIGQVAKRAGAGQMLVSDKFPWRLEVARKFRANTACCETEDVLKAAMEMTEGKGVDVAIESAWAGEAAQQAVEAVRPGARVVLVGIPGEDKLVLKHSTIRRKGLTIKLARRMKHVYPRAIGIWKRGEVDLKSMISHRFRLEKTAEAFKLNDAYERGVVKVIVEI